MGTASAAASVFADWIAMGDQILANGTPKLSVVIATRNRPKDAVDAVESVLSQEGQKVEVIVVDDASSDHYFRELEGALESDNGTHVMRSAAPIGACAARNLGARHASGDWLVFLDDDVVFADQRGLEAVRSAIRGHPEVSALGFRIVRYATGELCNWMYNRPRESEHRTQYVNKFPAGGGAILREAFFELGGFPERFGYYGEEAVLGLRLLDRGCKILYVPQVTLRHKVTPVARVPGRRIYYDVRNNIWLALLLLPGRRLFRHLISVMARQLILSARADELGFYFQGLRDGITGAREILKQRKPVQLSTARRGF